MVANVCCSMSRMWSATTLHAATLFFCTLRIMIPDQCNRYISSSTYLHCLSIGSKQLDQRLHQLLTELEMTGTLILKCIDESPFSCCLTRKRGRSRRGQRAVITVPQIKGKNHTVIAAISPVYGLVHYEIKVAEPEYEFLSKRKGSKKKKIKRKGVTRDIFRQFLLNLLELPMFHSPSSSSSSSSSSPQKYIFIYDNARIHKGDIDELIFNSGHTPQPLCPWSPALNPIEYAFSKWKSSYRSLDHSTDELVDEAIRTSSHTITPSDCWHYFQHTKSLYSKCLALEDLWIHTQCLDLWWCSLDR